MKPEGVHHDGPHADHHPHKPRHIAEKMESYLVRGMGLVGAGLLIFMLYSFMQTGTGTPSWMH